MTVALPGLFSYLFFHGVTIEHFLHGGEDLLRVTTAIVNQIFRFGRVTEALRMVH